MDFTKRDFIAFLAGMMMGNSLQTALSSGGSPEDERHLLKARQDVMGAILAGASGVGLHGIKASDVREFIRSMRDGKSEDGLRLIEAILGTIKVANQKIDMASQQGRDPVEVMSELARAKSEEGFN